jgi:flagellar hook-basal body complex protein FliE
MINFFTSKIEQNREKYQYFVRYKKSERIFADTEKAYYTTPEYYIDCVAREEFNSSKIEENRNQKTKEQKHSTPHLSKKLDTKQFKQVLKKAIDKGLIETNDDRYVWKGTKALFGYFVQKMNDYLKLKHGEKLDLKSFSETFNISTNKISSAIQDYKKGTGTACNYR